MFCNESLADKCTVLFSSYSLTDASFSDLTSPKFMLILNSASVCLFFLFYFECQAENNADFGLRTSLVQICSPCALEIRFLHIKCSTLKFNSRREQLKNLISDHLISFFLFRNKLFG